MGHLRKVPKYKFSRVIPCTNPIDFIRLSDIDVNSPPCLLLNKQLLSLLSLS